MGGASEALAQQKWILACVKFINNMITDAGADLDCRTGRTCDSQHSAAQQYF